MNVEATAAAVPGTNPLRSHPAVSYFLLTFGLSWLGALILTAPHLFRGEPLPQFTGLMVFPAMLLGPLIAGISMTATLNGRMGLRQLWSRMHRACVPARWYAVLVIPPVLILAVLMLFRATVSAAFAPNFFPVGLSFGIVAGFVEEIGWTGFAFLALTRERNPLAAAVLLGLLWSAWHIPAVDYLGAATPHRNVWLLFFLAFSAAMIAMRVLISWLYVNTGSVLLAQLLHASSTGALVVLSPPRVTPMQEATWYCAYGVVLWVAVGVIALNGGLKSRAG